MTYETYRYIFLGSLVLAVFFFILSCILFVKLRIPKIIADLTGRTERKGIEDIKRRSGQGTSAPEKSEKVTAKIRRPGVVTADLKHKTARGAAGKPAYDMSASANATTVLTNNETAVLESNATTVLTQPTQNVYETAVLAQPIQNINETVVLSQSEQTVGMPPVPEQSAYQAAYNVQPCAGFGITFEITYVSTEEILT